MDDRTYQLYRTYQGYVEFFTAPDLALWALKHHVEDSRFTQADMDAVLAEHERRKIDTSPILHLTQNQLDAMLGAFRPMPVPDELSA
jgi:hypothetical protein